MFAHVSVNLDPVQSRRWTPKSEGIVLERSTGPAPIRHKLPRRGKNRLATIQDVRIYSTVRSGTYLEPLGAPDLHYLIIFGTHCAHIIRGDRTKLETS